MRLLEAVILVSAIAIIISTFFISVLQIRGTSMEPTVQAGDLVIVTQNTDVKQGDIVAFYFNNKVLLKRLIGMPGDLVDIKDDGRVYINDVELREDYVSELSQGETDISFPYQVPENQFFVLGDHRSASLDSRSSVINTVSEDQIIGHVVWRIWPLSGLGALK